MQRLIPTESKRDYGKLESMTTRWPNNKSYHNKMLEEKKQTPISTSRVMHDKPFTGVKKTTSLFNGSYLPHDKLIIGVAEQGRIFLVCLQFCTERAR
jgi:hypothetical protein